MNDFPVTFSGSNSLKCMVVALCLLLPDPLLSIFCLPARRAQVFTLDVNLLHVNLVSAPTLGAVWVLAGWLGALQCWDVSATLTKMGWKRKHRLRLTCGDDGKEEKFWGGCCCDEAWAAPRGKKAKKHLGKTLPERGRWMCPTQLRPGNEIQNFSILP